MNQRYDYDNEDSPSDFEKRLSGVGLVAPSQEYRTIPDRLKAKNAARGWGPMHWISSGVLAGLVAVVALIQFDLSDPDTAAGNSSNELIGANTEQLPLSSQSTVTEEVVSLPPYISGTHYIELSGPVDPPDSTLTEVAAFFWYPCWPCSEFEEHLSDWESELPPGVALTRIPAIWSDAMRFHARAYYTAQVLGVLDRAHRQFYVQFNKDSPNISNEEELQQFFFTLGIPAIDFLAAYNSETTMQMLQHAEAENLAYQIQSIPSIFVAGRFGISPQSAGGFQEMLNVADFLIDEASFQSVAH